MKCKHYFFFGEHFNSAFYKNPEVSADLSKEKWDLLRTDNTVTGPFTLENSIEAYEENCRKSNGYQYVAAHICSHIKKEEHLLSVGIGKGVLEWQIKQLIPEIVLDASDYAEESINKLKLLFPACNHLFAFDMLKGDWSLLPLYDHVLLFRVSTEFNSETWQQIFQSMAAAGIEHIIYVPNELGTFSIFLFEYLQYILGQFRHRKQTFCGWLYSESEMKKFWKGQYEIQEAIPWQVSQHVSSKIYFLERIHH